MNPGVGTVLLFAGTVPPSGWLACNGATLLIAGYPALYQQIGIQYGGDGRKTFAVPGFASPLKGGGMYIIFATAPSGA